MNKGNPYTTTHIYLYTIFKIKFRIYPFVNISRRSNFFFLVSLLHRNDIYIYTLGLAYQIRDVTFTMLKIKNYEKRICPLRRILSTQRIEI